MGLHVCRNVDGAGVLGQGMGDGLAYPPGHMGGDAEASAHIEFFNAPREPDIAFLEHIQEREALGEACACISLRDCHDVAYIAFHQRGVCLVAGAHGLGKRHALLPCDEAATGQLLPDLRAGIFSRQGRAPARVLPAVCS